MSDGLKRASSLREFAVNPVGHWVHGSHFVYLAQSESLVACFVWGKPTVEAAREWTDALRVELQPGAVPHRAYMDFSGLTGVESAAFSLIRDFLEEVKHRQRVLIEREAIVRPSGVVGAVVAGFLAMFPPPYPAQVFAEPSDALRWLGVESRVHREWCAVRESLKGVPSELARLRELLAVHYRDADVAFVARHLSSSVRTLQRRLRTWGTAFRGELDAARLHQASARLLESDDKLAAVAQEVGFSSAQHFSDWFRSQTGMTADELRRQRSR